MSKGLTIARTFYRAGHRVVGADFEPYKVPVCGRFSSAIEKFYRLSKPSVESGPTQYIKELTDLIVKEKVELWVSCSSVASAIEDGEAAEIIEKETPCKAIQFGVTLTETLHEKHSFIDNTRRLGLNVPDTHLAIIFLIWPLSNSNPRPEPTTPALFDTAVMFLIEGVAFTSLISVSGTPQRPKPPHKTVLSDFKSFIASAAEGRTLFIADLGREDEKRRAWRMD